MERLDKQVHKCLLHNKLEQLYPELSHSAAGSNNQLESRGGTVKDNWFYKDAVITFMRYLQIIKTTHKASLQE